jgi:ABC-type nitrate/sulfonate/bicarbonate transport system permease component
MAPRRIKRLPYVLTWVSLVAVALLWWAIDRIGLLSAIQLPGPEEIVRVARDGLRKGYLFQDLKASLSRLVPGLFLGALLGAMVGVLTGRVGILAAMVSPTLHMWRALPTVALVPILVKVLGIDEAAKLLIIATGVFFPVWVSTHTGATLIERRYLDLARTMDLPLLHRYTKIIVPATIPFIVAGTRTGIAAGYVMLFIAEWIAADAGIGYRIAIGHTVSRVDLMVLGLIELAALAYATDYLFGAWARRAMPWLPQTNE